MSEVTETPRRRNNYAWPIIWWTLALCSVYAVVRYHVMGGVPWKDLPLFILNKILSMTALILLAINFTLWPLKNVGVALSNQWMRSRRLVGISGFLLVFAHLIISFLIFKPAFYGKFFDETGTLTLVVGLSMLFGVLAFIFLWMYNVSFSSTLRKDKDLIGFITSRKVLLIAFSFTGFHLFFIGYQGWLKPEGWHGGLPPISLISFAFFAVGFVINLFGRKDPD